MSETVPVVRGDREAAAAWWLFRNEPDIAAEILAGDNDAKPFSLVQAFARHRLAAIEEAARVADDCADKWAETTSRRHREGFACEQVASAIRALGRGEG